MQTTEHTSQGIHFENQGRHHHKSKTVALKREEIKMIQSCYSVTVTSLCFSDEIRGMIPQELLHANDMLNSVDGYSQPAPQPQGVSEDWLAFPKIVSIQLHLRNRPKSLFQI